MIIKTGRKGKKLWEDALKNFIKKENMNKDIDYIPRLDEVHQAVKEVPSYLEITNQYIIVVKTSKNKWEEAYPYDGITPVRYFINMIEQFNKTKKKHELKRTLVNVYQQQVLTKYIKL